MVDTKKSEPSTRLAHTPSSRSSSSSAEKKMVQYFHIGTKDLVVIMIHATYVGEGARTERTARPERREGGMKSPACARTRAPAGEKSRKKPTQKTRTGWCRLSFVNMSFLPRGREYGKK